MAAIAYHGLPQGVRIAPAVDDRGNPVLRLHLAGVADGGGKMEATLVYAPAQIRAICLLAWDAAAALDRAIPRDVPPGLRVAAAGDAR